MSVDGISITGLSKSQAREVLLKEFPWSMTVSYDSEVYEVNDLMAGKIDSLLNEIYSGEPQESYTLDTAGLEEQIKAEAAACAAKWDKKAKMVPSTALMQKQGSSFSQERRMALPLIRKS